MSKKSQMAAMHYLAKMKPKRYDIEMVICENSAVYVLFEFGHIPIGKVTLYWSER